MLESFASSFCFSASSASTLAMRVVLTRIFKVSDGPGRDDDKEPDASVNDTGAESQSLGSSCT